jgi:hypothetical protein
MAKNAAAKREREAAWMITTAAMRDQGVGSVIDEATVTFRVRRSRLFDSDNMIYGLKHIRDGVACALAGIPAGSNAPDSPKDKYKWQYAEQEKSKQDMVIIEVESE